MKRARARPIKDGTQSNCVFTQCASNAQATAKAQKKKEKMNDAEDEVQEILFNHIPFSSFRFRFACFSFHSDFSCFAEYLLIQRYSCFNFVAVAVVFCFYFFLLLLNVTITSSIKRVNNVQFLFVLFF